MAVQLKMPENRMYISSPKNLLNLYDFLPPDGEDGYKITTSKGLVELEIYFCSPQDDGAKSTRTIKFNRVLYFFSTPMLGHSFFESKGNDDVSIVGSLVEYGESGLVDENFRKTGLQGYRHFRVILPSSEIVISAVAKNVAF